MAAIQDTCNHCRKPFQEPEGIVETWILPPGPNSQCGYTHLHCSGIMDTVCKRAKNRRVIPLSLTIGLLAGWGGTRLFSQVPLKVVMAAGGFAVGSLRGFVGSSIGIRAWHRSHYRPTNNWGVSLS